MNCLAFDRFLASLPKTETHLHVEGALPWELLQQKNPDRFSKTPAFRKPDFRYENFEQFESILIEHAMCWFDSVESYYEAAKVIFSKHLQQNVKYVETSFHAGMMEFLKLPGEEILAAILDAVPEGLEVRVFLGISRNAYTPYLGPLLEHALTWDQLSGIDLHGLESLPFESWIPRFWKTAREEGKVVKAHAGEFGPASNISQAVNELGVNRIQHGTRAIEDEDVMGLLVEKDITLDMCPISNYKLKVVDHLSQHPIKEFMQRGIKCTVSTDDPFSFNNSLVDEFNTLREEMSFTYLEIAELISNGFKVANLDAIKKQNFIDQIDREIIDVEKNCG
ncbi:MAG: adenosine deaminase [Opitutae bacterium]|jgi:adenine deaminase|nr:adenosine deaminase [Opitutae bacterium]MBT5715858.1 adenosine deaminase [Opitutae bacterium]